VHSSPVIGPDGVIYVGSNDYDLYAIYPDGTKKWEFPTGREIGSAPTIGSNGTIYICASDGYFYAITPNGKKIWQFAMGHPATSSPPIASDGTIYVGDFYGNKLIAINPDGTQKWTFPLLDSVASSAVIGPDGTIYFGAYDHQLYALHPDGSEKWDYKTNGQVYSTPAIGPDGMIYFGSDDNNFYALYPDGTLKWDFVTGNQVYSSPALGSDGTIYFGSYDGNLYALYPNGTKKWEFVIGQVVYSSPAIGSDGTIYVGAEDGNLYAVKPDGKQRWSFSTGDIIESSPAIGSDGTVYVGSDDDKLYAIGTYSPPTCSTQPLDLNALGGMALVDLSWTAPSSDGGSAITNYMIYRGTTSGSEVFLAKIGNELSYQDTKVSSGQEYFYEVSAINSIGESPRSNEANATPFKYGPADSPWPMFRHDLNHTGRSQYDTSMNDGLEKWSFTTGGNVTASPSIGSDGTIYVGSWDNKFYAIYPNGTKRWDFTTGDQVRSSAAIGSDGTIFIGSYDCKLYALNPDGTKKWAFTTGGRIDSSPMIGSDGIIYFGSYDAKLYALYPNGTKKWDFTTGADVFSSPAIGADGTIYFTSEDGKLYALYPNGAKKWEYATGYNVYSSPAIGPDGTVYFGSYDNKFYAINPNGTKKWDFNVGKYFVSSAAIGSNGTIYVGVYAAEIDALSPNGKVNWEWGVGEYPTTSPSIGSDGTIYAGSAWVIACAIIPSPTWNWEFKIDTGGSGSSPSIGSDGTIYVGANDAKLYAIGKPVAPSTPTAPIDLKAVGGNAIVDLTWTAPLSSGGRAITNYTIYKATYPGHESNFVTIGNLTSYHDTKVTNGQKYYYEVTASNPLGEGPASNEAFALPGTTPSAPQNLSAVPGNAQVVLKWKAPVDSGGFSSLSYKVYRDGVLLKELGNMLSYTDPGLVNGLTYSYNISALNPIGEGPKSIGASAIPRTVPGPPRNLTATLGTAQILLTWLMPDSNGGAPITNYSIYRGTIAGGETLFVKGYTGGTTWTDTNMTQGVTNYYYVVSAVNIAGEGPFSNEVNLALGVPPGPPTHLTATEGNTQVILRWSKPASGGTVAHYNIYRADSKTGNFTFIASSNTTRYKDTGLKNGHKYWYKVNAQNIYGVSGNTTEVSATPYGTSIISSLILVIIIVIVVVLTIVEARRASRKKKA